MDVHHDAALETMHTVLLALHRRDALRNRPSPPVNLRDPRRAFLVGVFRRTVAKRLPLTAGARARPRQHSCASGVRPQQRAVASSPHAPPPRVTPDGGAAPPAERARRPAAVNEARGARFRRVPPKSTLQRLRRSNVRLFLVEQQRVAHNVAQFVVMGVNGAIYRVHIGLQPKCDCPDFVRRSEEGSLGPCKHMLFVFMKVLKLEEHDHRWFQVRLVPSELEGLLTPQSQHHPSIMADQRVVEQYRVSTAPVQRKPVEGPCPVCFEQLQHADISRAENVVSFCSTCGHNYHQLCFDNFLRTRQHPVCPACRKRVQRPANATTNTQGSQYLNLMAYSSSHRRELTLAELYADSHQYIAHQTNQTRGTNATVRRS